MENEPDLPEIHVRSLLMLRHLLSLFSCLLCLTVFAACGDDRRGDDDDTTIEDTNPEDLDGDGFCPGDDCEDNDLNPGDCDDADGDAYPGNVESCDASDNNCDGRIDELAPSPLVDLAWHAHLLDTRAYMRDCDALFGEYLHHAPTYDLAAEKEQTHMRFEVRSNRMQRFRGRGSVDGKPTRRRRLM